MIYLVTVIIILACVAVGFFVLIQNPKGGGLTGSFGSIGSQVMGVKQTTDVMEKGTWTAIGVVAVLCIFTVTMFKSPKETNGGAAPQKAQTSAPAKKGK